jgi:hypothetical protein
MTTILPDFVLDHPDHEDPNHFDFWFALLHVADDFQAAGLNKALRLRAYALRRLMDYYPGPKQLLDDINATELDYVQREIYNRLVENHVLFLGVNHTHPMWRKE